ncbi:YihY/virulence factor BrkB family protein [Streptomyces zingiberis]|uniref:YihY/virulence factor BrkB family protein n=1 Tax=Streptomyces zingiberis TaxID=2053010 RepID=A0ABX1C4W3_9ACTN|nr:YihY/virulence factor BrkB family protein [Streptomyces zingiberis]NJQ03836.1 YihY/virulence factor BrkB family protein [Streptomyces zingiberis]
MQAAESSPKRQPGRLRRARALYPHVSKRQVAWLLLKDTVNSCIEYRILGLAAEAAFFTLLSLPPLLLGLVGLLGYLDAWIGTDTIDSIRQNIITASHTVLTDRGVDQLVRPMLDDVTGGGRPDVVSLGFAIALWSGSRAVNVFIDTITVMYGLDGHRGIVKTRLLAFLLYLIALLIGAVVLPLMVVGPEAVIGIVPWSTGLVRFLYWPVVLVLSVVFLTTLYHVSVPVRSAWAEDIPGALVALAMWVLGSFLLRLYLAETVEGPTIYGSLAAPVAVLLWIGVSAFAVLVGAAVNAAVDRVWPSVATAAARERSLRLREREAAEVIARAKADRAALAPVTGPDGPEGAAGGTGGTGAGEDDLDDPEEGPGAGEGEAPDREPPPEFPERWARFLPPEDIRSRLPHVGRGRGAATPERPAPAPTPEPGDGTGRGAGPRERGPAGPGGPVRPEPGDPGRNGRPREETRDRRRPPGG